MNKLLTYKGKELTILIKKEHLLKENSIDGDFLMCGREVATMLGYKNTSDAILRNVYPEDKINIRNNDIREGFNIRKLNNAGEIFINESGMYSLIFNCSLDEAKQFKRWVTSEVLPEIRKTGSYRNNIEISEDKIRLIVEKLALENMLDMKTDKVKESIKYLKAYGITRAKANDLVIKSIKYNLSLDTILEEYLLEQKAIDSKKYEGKIRLAIIALARLGYTQQDAWIKFAEIASKATGQDLNKIKIQASKAGYKKSYLDLVRELKIEKECSTAINRYVTSEKKKLIKNYKII